MKINNSKPAKRQVIVHKIGNDYLVEDEGVLAWKIVMDASQVTCRLYRFDEGRGLVLVDTAPFIGELIENIEAGGYDPLDPDHPFGLHDL